MRTILIWTAVAVLTVTPAFAQDVTKYVRYEYDGNVSYGVLEDETIHPLRGDIFESLERTGDTVGLGAVMLLPPTAPKKVIAIGFNYGSHLGDAEPASEPGVFDKHPTSLIPHDGEITYYADANNLHYEGEMVLIIGRTAKDIPVEEADDYIFAVAPGNDVSERDWQANDLQWFRAKGADTFGPVGPVMAAGVNYNDILLETRVNGEVMQSQRTKDLIFNPARIVSFVSRYVTLEAGDMIFTGTPGTTSAIEPGDVVEISLEGVGVLRNTVGPKQTR